MSEHAKFSPSKLSRILACPASGRAQGESESSKYADEGTMLHDLTAKAIETYQSGLGNWVVNLGQEDINTEQQSAVEECVQYAIDLIESFDNPTVFIETRVHITPDCHGTADLIVQSGHELHVVDWKFGQGIEVSAYENVQLMTYAYGAMCAVEDEVIKTFMLHVIQPRLNNFDTWAISYHELTQWKNKALVPGLELAESPKAPFHPSVEACRWCPSKGFCSARMSQAMNDASEVFAAHAKLPEIDVDNFGRLLDMAGKIEACIKDLKLHATSLLQHDPNSVKGFKLVRGRSTRAWLDEEKAAEFLATHLEIEDMYITKMVSPSQAEKLLDKKTRKDEDFTIHITKPEGKVTLAAETDRRPALKLNAEAVFAGCKLSS